eukprot:TRINITY_DN506_c0_g1_i4.p1 TRINITY_DN506_c0_g1~~TRINITY_DN506_c0_g1_i4.p1  ORF type:complete len:114 (+),score=9.31 TRINITY_DN506_c0_g1_i4:126-467(+)
MSDRCHLQRVIEDNESYDISFTTPRKVGMNNEEEYTFSSIVPKCPQCKMELSLRDIKGTWLVQCKATITGQVMKSDGRFERKITELEAKEPLYISSAESGVQFTRTKFRMYPL